MKLKSVSRFPEHKRLGRKRIGSRQQGGAIWERKAVIVRLSDPEVIRDKAYSGFRWGQFIVPKFSVALRTGANDAAKAMGDDLPPKTETDCRYFLGYTVFGERDFGVEPGIVIRIPVFFVSGFSTAIDHGNRYGFIDLGQSRALIWHSPVQFIAKLCKRSGGMVCVLRAITAVGDENSFFRGFHLEGCSM